jgi:hypothetical protein
MRVQEIELISFRIDIVIIKTFITSGIGTHSAQVDGKLNTAPWTPRPS